MNKTLGLVALLACLMVGGCATKPLRNIPEVAIASPHTVEEVRQAIVAAGAGKGWEMKDVEPGLVRATLHVRTHVAVADIAFTSTTYSITYVDSTNLNYEDGNIHGNYNRWVQNLTEAIQARLNSE